MLHPGLKLQYFKDHHWKQEWIEAAEELVRDEFVSGYEGRLSVVEAAVEVASRDTSSPFAMFADISVGKKRSEARCELVEYLQLSMENVGDPLKWWVVKQGLYPNLYRMALDYLSIPGKPCLFSFDIII